MTKMDFIALAQSNRGGLKQPKERKILGFIFDNGHPVFAEMILHNKATGIKYIAKIIEAYHPAEQEIIADWVICHHFNITKNELENFLLTI